MQRYYFHLVDGQEVISDEVGVEVADLARARGEVMSAVGEFLRECADNAAASKGWRIEVTDAWGTVALRIDLSELTENS